MRRAATPTAMIATVAYAAAVAFALPRTSGAVTTYGGASSLAAALDLVAGLALIAAGLALWLVRGNGALGPVATAAGVVWLAPDWVGWEGGSAIARSLAAFVPPFLPVLVLHAVWAGPEGRLPGRLARTGVAGAYAVTAGLAAATALFRDPFEDPYCWSNCTDNVLLVSAERELARALEAASRYVAVAIAVAVVVVGIASLLRASPGRRATQLALTLPAVVLAAGQAAYAVALLSERQEDPQRDLFAGLFVWRATGAVALAAGLVAVLARELRRRRTVARLAADLRSAPAPGALRDSLSAALGDPSLEVGYWLEAEDRFVDAGGDPVSPPAGRTATPLQRDGRLVATLWHDPAVSASEVEAQLGAAARLAIENERLQAELLARLHELTALRTRVLERSDEERRRLERDLHDGAQQRLLALSFELRVAAAHAPALAAAVEDAQAALAELRELASGIHPAILTDAGLGPALESLADAAPVPLLVDAVPDTRFPAPIEVTAYLLVADQVEGRRSGAPTVRVTARDGSIEVEVADAREVAAHVAERVQALAGSLELGDGTLRAVLPVS